MNGGGLIAEVLKIRGVQYLFTLCGGHISPILVGAKQRGIRVIDVRHEANAVFAADAVGRLTGRPGVAAVTAGPGATNTITAVKNAQQAQSPLVLLVGATATALKGRGALQDIDQIALLKPHVKWIKSVERVGALPEVVHNAFRIAGEGVPGPVVVECPVDLLYDESLVRQWYGIQTPGGERLMDRAIRYYLERHVHKLFENVPSPPLRLPEHSPLPPEPLNTRVRHTVQRLERVERPLLLIGSQAVIDAPNVAALAKAVAKLGIPVYLSGMARGLLPKNHPLYLRHQRRQALKEADLVLLAGVPNDFRLDYGRHIRRGTYLISVNRSRHDMNLNRRPDLGIMGDAGWFLRKLAATHAPRPEWKKWLQTLRARDERREQEIDEKAASSNGAINPLLLCREIEKIAAPDRVFVADGGDFVATASYIVQPGGPLRWLDPGVFGTLGVGAGFALGAKLVYPKSEVWILYGDGSVGYTLAEFDTFARHGIPVIAVVGNDASWMQIAREQVEILKDDVGTTLARSDYHIAAKGLGGAGLLLRNTQSMGRVLRQAQKIARNGTPVLINAHLDKTDFRKGSISM